MIEEFLITTPCIEYKFDPYLLDTYLGRSKRHVETKIEKLQRKKIRPQDTGKRRDYDKLIKEYHEEYERKKIAEENYDSETKKLIEKVPVYRLRAELCDLKEWTPQKDPMSNFSRTLFGVR